MDSSITPLRHGGLSLVQTTDFFYPLVEDPYMQGTSLNNNYLRAQIDTADLLADQLKPILVSLSYK